MSHRRLRRDLHGYKTHHSNVVSFVAAGKSHTPLVRLTVADGLTTDLTGVRSIAQRLDLLAQPYESSQHLLWRATAIAAMCTPSTGDIQRERPRQQVTMGD